jgi:glucose/arabinose dehydrogenase
MNVLYLFMWFFGIVSVSDVIALGEYNILFLSTAKSAQGSNQRELTNKPGHPAIYDPNLHAELVAEDLELPTTMAFLGPNDILVLEKNKGTVRRITNDRVLSQPLLDVDVANKYERGMLGIAVDKKNSEEGMNTHVFLFFSEGSSDKVYILGGKPDIGSQYSSINEIFTPGIRQTQ